MKKEEEKNFIGVFDGIDPISGLPKVRLVSAEEHFPTKEPKYSLLTRIRWKIEKVLGR